MEGVAGKKESKFQAHPSGGMCMATGHLPGHCRSCGDY